jgi:hypothetical protein
MAVISGNLISNAKGILKLFFLSGCAIHTPNSTTGNVVTKWITEMLAFFGPEVYDCHNGNRCKMGYVDSQGFLRLLVSLWG